VRYLCDACCQGFAADITVADGDPIADPDALHCIRAVYARGTAVPGAGTRHRARPFIRLPAKRILRGGINRPPALSVSV